MNVSWTIKSYNYEILSFVSGLYKAASNLLLIQLQSYVALLNIIQCCLHNNVINNNLEMMRPLEYSFCVFLVRPVIPGSRQSRNSLITANLS